MLRPAKFLNGKARSACGFERMAHERCGTLWAIGSHVLLRESEFCRRRRILKHGPSGETATEVKDKAANLSEQSILAAIKNGVRTIQAIVPIVYPTLDKKLATAASLSVQAHVEHLIQRGLVVCDGLPSWDQRLSLA